MAKNYTRLNDDFVRDTKSGKDRVQAFKDIQQPISPDGFTNPYFDKFYGHNPFKGTERDRQNRTTTIVGGFETATGVCDVCGKSYEWKLETGLDDKLDKWCRHDGGEKIVQNRL